MPWPLFSAKQPAEPKVTYHQSHLEDQTSVKSESTSVLLFHENVFENVCHMAGIYFNLNLINPCRLLSAKPLPVPMLTYCQLDVREWT